MGIYTKLDAINYMLVASGERPVNSLETEEGVDTSVALFTLGMSRKTSISRGVSNNKYANIFEKDAFGIILLPGLTINIRNITPVIDSRLGTLDSIGIIDSPVRLFNMTKQTDVFEEDMELEITVDIPWERIETNMQRAIMATAARDYQYATLGDPQVDSFLGQREALYYSKGRAQDIKNRNRNFLYPTTEHNRLIAWTKRIWG